jgi:hypothetical protein
VAFWSIALLAAAAVGVLSLSLRAPTLGGATSEIREYLQPETRQGGLTAVYQALANWNVWLVPAALLGLPFRWPRRARATLLYLAILVMVLFHSFVLFEGDKPRYMVIALPLMIVAAAHGTARTALGLGRRLLRGEWTARLRVGLGGALLLGLLIASIDVDGVQREIKAGSTPSNAIRLKADVQPDDLILSYAPTVTTYYFGRTDFWLRPRGYVKYVFAGDPPLHDVHSGGILIRSREELDKYVLAPNSGRRLWAIIDPATSYSPGVREVEQALIERGAQIRMASDGRKVMRVQL